jgi:hypothetical protein
LSAELVIDRGEETDAVARVRERVEDHPDRMAEALRGHDPVGIDGPAVRVIATSTPRRGSPVVEAVAEDPVIDHRLQRLDDRRRGAEIAESATHMAIPSSGFTPQTFPACPTCAMGAAAIEKFVETCHGQPSARPANLASRATARGG